MSDHTMNSMIFCHEGDLFAVKPLARHGVDGGSLFVRFEAEVQTSELGQRLFLALLEQETLSMAPGSPGAGITIDPETGSVEDVINGSGVIGYVTTAPFPAHERQTIVIEAHIYDKVMIPRFWVGSESVLHPAILIEQSSQISAFGGSEIMNGSAAIYYPRHIAVVPEKRRELSMI
jgi:hypothetical protein